MVGYVQFITHEKQDEVISGSDNDGAPKSLLGPVTSTIIENVIQGNVVLIFSQGDLNLTPLLASLSLETDSKGRDILIGIPKHRYNQLNTLYYENFFSLTKGNGQFFYKNTLWCSVKKKDSDDESETLLELDDIKFKPKWGNRKYKEDFEASTLKKINDRSINERSFIVTFPFSVGFADIILDNAVLMIESESVRLRPIVPKLIILESVNDTIYTFDPLMPLIDYLLKSEIGAVIHFSWPYIAGLERFLGTFIASNEGKSNRLKSFHLGKRFSFEIKDYVIQDILHSTHEHSILSAMNNHPALKQVSLEGRNWETYYPSLGSANSQNILLCAPVNKSINLPTLDETLRELSTSDKRIKELKVALKDIILPDNSRYLFRFMPFVDSFVPPVSLGYTFKFDDNTYRRLELLQVITEVREKVEDSDHFLLDSLASIVKRMSETFNFVDYLHNLKTPPVNTKYSAVVSFLIKALFHGEDQHIILCDYNPRLGFKNYMSKYLREIFQLIEKQLPFSYNRLQRGDFIMFFGEKFYFDIEAENYEITKFEFNENGSGLSFEIIASLTVYDGKKYTSKKVTVELESMEELHRNINHYDFKNTILLLPGPLPILRFDGETPVISDGIDLFLRPFKKIIVFINQGENYVRAIKQIVTIKDFLFGSRDNPIAKKDLQISYQLNNSPEMRARFDKVFRRVAVSDDSNGVPGNTFELQGTIDEPIREEFMENEAKVDTEYYRTLKELWGTISRSKTNTAPSPVKYEAPEEYSQIRVRYDLSGAEEYILIRKGTYVRLVEEGNNEIILVENLLPGQRMAYLKSDTRESLDNYFIRNYSSYSGITVEQIYEPFKCFGIFYNVLSKVDFSNNYSENDFAPLYWLSSSEKQQLYKNIQFFMEPVNNENTNSEHIREHFKNSIVWEILTKTTTDLLRIAKEKFTLNFSINLDSLYVLAQLFGFDYGESSFKSLMSDLLSGKTKYFFIDENNLLAIARLLNHTLIIDNYENLTSAGKNIRTVLQHVGKSLNRVISGNKRYLSDMDLLIENKVTICTVL